jgi:electron transport complex protein RnfE
MKRSIAELITRDPEKFAHHDRVFKNNPVVMQGMGLAPLVVLATTGKNALMLAVAVALLLTPSRMLACLVSRLFPLREEHPANAELEKKLLPRSILYSGSAAVVYLAAYPILNRLFGVSLLVLGIYLPMLVVEPLLTYRFGRVQETVHKAVSKGVRITVGYALLLLVVGVVREWLSLGTVFGAPVGRWALLPLAKMPAGGFIVLCRRGFLVPQGHKAAEQAGQHAGGHQQQRHRRRQHQAVLTGGSHDHQRCQTHALHDHRVIQEHAVMMGKLFGVL